MILYELIWFDMFWHDLIWFDMMWCNLIWIDMILYDLIWFNMIWYGLIGFEMIRYDLLWEGPVSQPQSTLSRWKKLPPLIKNSDPPPKLGPKKTLSIIAFRIALTLDVTIVWFGRQVAVNVQKWHKNAIFGCSLFQKFNFDCLLLKLLIYLPTTEKLFKYVCPLLTQSSIMIPGT